jgi:hypothetical protein
MDGHREQWLRKSIHHKWNVLGPVLGVDVMHMAKRSQGWAKCEDRRAFPTAYRDSSCSLPLPRLHDHNSTTREDLAAGVGAPGVKGPLEWGSWGLNAARGRCLRAVIGSRAPQSRWVSRVKADKRNAQLRGKRAATPAPSGGGEVGKEKEEDDRLDRGRDTRIRRWIFLYLEEKR